MRTTVNTLDAIHLASAPLLAERMETDLVFGTHDWNQAIAARAQGFGVVGAVIRY